MELSLTLPSLKKQNCFIGTAGILFEQRKQEEITKLVWADQLDFCNTCYQ